MLRILAILSLGSWLHALPIESIPKSEVIFFGVWSPERWGHFHYEAGGRSSGVAERLPTRLQWEVDGRYCRPGEQKEGVARIRVVQGWTIVSFWDRTGDKRHGSNCSLLVKGQHSFDDMIALWKAWFPSVWKRFHFEVVLEGDCPDVVGQLMENQKPPPTPERETPS